MRTEAEIRAAIEEHVFLEKNKAQAARKFERVNTEFRIASALRWVLGEEHVMIKPTVGRIVWYYPYYPRSTGNDGGYVPKPPLAAIVAFVWSDDCVNLAVFDEFGNVFSRTSVLLVQDGAPRPDVGFCEWMPDQKGQAAKYEALAAQTGAAGASAA